MHPLGLGRLRSTGTGPVRSDSLIPAPSPVRDGRALPEYSEYNVNTIGVHLSMNVNTIQVITHRLGLDTVVFWTSSVVSCAVFDVHHHHTYTGDEYSA